MISKNYIKVLRKLSSELNNNSNVVWLICGSTGLALQGMPIKPNDIDIRTDKKGSFKIEKIFQEFIDKKVNFSSTRKIRSYFGALNIDGVKIEIMGDMQKKIGNKWEKPLGHNLHKRIIKFKGMILPVFPIEDEYYEYQKMNRYGKAKIIKMFLQNNRQV